ncbi:MAG: helix-turn-helix domain-containing protein [Pseudonocardia sp.]|nr:helix-turn-helix domain-containing protein [Pseudonocardia sp.]
MKPTPSTIRIREDNLALVRAAAGLASNGALAQRMGVAASTVSRTLNGQSSLGVSFIAGVMATFPGVPFGELFAVEPVDAPAVAEAIPA